MKRIILTIVLAFGLFIPDSNAYLLKICKDILDHKGKSGYDKVDRSVYDNLNPDGTINTRYVSIGCSGDADKTCPNEIPRKPEEDLTGFLPPTIIAVCEAFVSEMTENINKGVASSGFTKRITVMNTDGTSKDFVIFCPWTTVAEGTGTINLIVE